MKSGHTRSGPCLTQGPLRLKSSQQNKEQQNGPCYRSLVIGGFDLMDLRILGEWVIPVAAIILLLATELFGLDEIAAGWNLVKRIVKRMQE